jgi:eukaryotic-like serine/threonine-protein kinase
MYPNISDYKRAISHAKNCLETLSVEPVRAGLLNREPVFSAGGFAAVFKVKDQQGRFYAIKCFTKNHADMERFEAISRHLKPLGSSYFIDYEYLDDELYVTSQSAGDGAYPVLKMEWVEGNTLGEYLQTACENRNIEAIRGVYAEWNELCQFLISHQIAHGDLKHDNVIVTPAKKLVLIDYDDMYVPALRGREAIGMGGPAYQHPKRKMHFDENLDHFSMLVIKISLRALIRDPALYAKYNDSESIIFREDDFKNTDKSSLIRRLEQLNDKRLTHWLQVLKRSCKSDDIAIPELDAILNPGPKSLFKDPHPAVMGLQRRIAKFALNRAGSTHLSPRLELPPRMESLLSKTDAFSAVDQYLDEQGEDDLKTILQSSVN